MSPSSSAPVSGRSRQRLSRERWIDAAIVMVQRDGLERLGVEPLAAELEATKGSFYWHFANRAELIDAVLSRWEERATTRVIADSEQEAAPLGCVLSSRLL